MTLEEKSSKTRKHLNFENNKILILCFLLLLLGGTHTVLLVADRLCWNNMLTLNVFNIP